MKRRYVLILILLALGIEPAYPVNKCVESDGRILYQAEPCPAGAHGGDMNLNVNRSFTGGVKQPNLPPLPSLPAESPVEIVEEPAKPDAAEVPPDTPKPITPDEAVAPPTKHKSAIDHSKQASEDPPLIETFGDH